MMMKMMVAMAVFDDDGVVIRFGTPVPLHR
jgi:hypothetical protein